ncbi:hypothetical protein HRUBRA_01746 [Pseudohaliea rubra DSM 19751]|uniref:Uncharacterized protein n=2 Tax=Pseudohaliea TaxID=1341120 RepID=A0A095VQL9_9GAMM|nr:hypothetical protein HRUBRA_01746 [Pseudohaliea rubra DSM 19751]
MTLILLGLATFGALAVASGTLSSHRGAGTDQRGKEVYAVATGGLNHALAWFEEHAGSLAFSDDDAGGVWRSAGAGTTSPVTATAYVDKSLGTDAYDLAIEYELLSTLSATDPSDPLLVRARATGRAEGDSHVQRTVSVDLLLTRKSVFSPLFAAAIDSFSAPAVLVEDGLSGITGTPEAYPLVDDGIAIGITRGGTADVATGNLSLEDGGKVGALSGTPSLSEAVFGLSPSGYDGDGNPVGANAAEQMLRALAERHPDAVKVVDSSANWHQSLGSADEPVIVFFTEEAGCPKINGNTTIHGLVYFETRDCQANGWGKATIYGSVAFAGAPTKLSANTEFHARQLDFSYLAEAEGGGNRFALGLAKAELVRIPGSWRDF